ncbi:ATP-dependent zinc protease [Hyphobacterium sp. HN65]|uniref:ATP-dependent zinc protease n=1 Tax=Hyphobacterium lacteum TaxID=3116575 RepID=A0ABU7LQZ9_9PROT|nr:ATP-dependent zinc protease [Hyphobacterium sp. HN65]MEE2526339.1 ATP-dependent zinc protease [Hyphobacterium sp. HN65]
MSESRKRRSLFTIGWREWVELPDFDGTRIKAKIDTGARTSAVHAWKIEAFERDGEKWVRFELHPKQKNNTHRVPCEARVLDERLIRSSNGQITRRYVIRTRLKLGNRTWPIDLTLSRRDEMGFRMLLGRTALRGRTLIDAAASYLCGD